MLFPRLALAALLLAPLSGHAAEFWLIAKPTSLMAEGSELPMWGFARASREQFGRALAGETISLTATVPGPPLQVPAGDGEVTIHLLNQLPQPVSLILHGHDQGKPAEAAAGGGLQTYRWSGIKPGSFLYESGTDPAFQVQMGLYGPLAAEGVVTPIPASTRQWARASHRPARWTTRRPFTMPSPFRWTAPA
jgi:FtsP/CotA-like multicopper oxidase with cupredoxin domain